MAVDIIFRSGNGNPLSSAQVDANFKALKVAVEALQAVSSGVTSVGLSMPAGFAVANSPITGSGTINVTTSLNGIIKGNGSGFTAVPTINAATELTGVVPIANGGTNNTTFTSNRAVVYDGTKLATTSTTTTELGYLSGVTSAIQTQINSKEPTITTLSVAKGGTGIGTTPTNGQVLIGTGTGYTPNTLTAGSGININNGAGSITLNARVDIDNTAFVSKNGNDATGNVGSVINKYLTIGAALSAAGTSPVHVYAGTYTENITLENGQIVYLHAGAVIDGTVTMGNGTNYLMGEGLVNKTGAGDAILINGNGSSSNYIGCFSVTGGTGASGYAIRKTGSGYAEVMPTTRSISARSGSDIGVYNAAGTIHIFCQVIQIIDGTSITTALIKNDATMLLDIDQAVLSTSSAIPILFIAGTGSSRYYFNLLTGFIQVTGTGKNNIRGKGSTGSIKVDTGINPIKITTASATSLKLSNLNLAVVSYAGTDRSINATAANQTVWIDGRVVSNVDHSKSPDPYTVTITGGTFTINTALDTSNP